MAIPRTLTWAAVLAAAVLSVLLWLRAGQSPGPGGSAPAAATQPDQRSTSAALADPAAETAPASAAPGPATQALSQELSGQRIAELQLTRQLAGEHRFNAEGRRLRVIGSKETVDAGGTALTMVVIVDETSGQVRYHLPGLQFSLKPGVDYEAFLREHPRMHRLFVNQLYAQVAVDAADIAGQFERLRADPRVERLRLMTRNAVHRPK